MFLSEPEIRVHLSTLTYRPGWSWTLERDVWEGLFVRFIGLVEDSYNANKKIALGINSWLPPMMSTEQLDAWMAWRLWRIEGHEAREFLCRDNQPIFDPHAS